MRPIILIGAGCPQTLADYLCTLGIPILVSWQGIDRVPEDSPSFVASGVIGMRAANIIQQKADVVYIFGARMDMEQVNHKYEHFAPNAIKHVFEIDKAEIAKLPDDWIKCQTDLSNPALMSWGVESNPDWLLWCRRLYKRFRYELDGTNTVEDFVDPYLFIRHLSDVCEEGEVIVPGSSGMQSCAFMQAFKVKRGQKILLCNTTGAMGLEPMAIGAALASSKRVICVTGDGGFYLNFQELEVTRRLGLNIKYFVFCNDGYGSITTMQDARFNLRVGGDPSSGFTLPPLSRVAPLFDMPYFEIDVNSDCDQIRRIVNSPSAALVRVNTTLAFRYACKVQSSLKDGKFVNDDMENMYPYIDDLERVMAE
jgi:acetolactate synthase-1/2/3 large subunit